MKNKIRVLLVDSDSESLGSIEKYFSNHAVIKVVKSLNNGNNAINYIKENKNLFDIVLGRESSAETKESGALTKMALEKVKANPKTTIMIGDAPTSDILGGIQVGMRTCWVNATGKVCPENIRPDYEIPALSHLEDLLEKM